VEKEIKEIYNKSNNNQLINSGEYPIIWFKNIEKIISDFELEQSLLPIFDPQQNTKLFGDQTNLSNFILIATSSTRDMGKLSPPLTSRLDCINVATAKPRQFFLDKYFVPISIGSIVLIFALLLVIF
jgi:ATP-dependent Lon protease